MLKMMLRRLVRRRQVCCLGEIFRRYCNGIKHKGIFYQTLATTIKMLSTLHSRHPLLLRHHLLKPFSSSFRRLYSVTPSAPGNSPTNTSPPPAPVQNVSDSNALPTSAEGARDTPLQETPEEGEGQRQLQAPNRAAVWSRSQQPREKAMVGPRFEQTIMQHQVRR